MPLFKPMNVNARVLDQFSLSGKIAAVTGGAKGIGLEVVRGLAEAGADVALIFKSSQQAAEDAAATISRDTGRRVQTYKCDVSRRQEADKTMQRIAMEFGRGRLDIVVANAGVCAVTAALDVTEDSWAANNGPNLDGAMWTAQAAGKIFKELGKGNLIFTASMSGSIVNIPQTISTYCASKAAVVHLAKSLALEWVEFARVNAISPGFVMTDVLSACPADLLSTWVNMTPGKRICDPAELKSVSSPHSIHLVLALVKSGFCFSFPKSGLQADTLLKNRHMSSLLPTPAAS
jgi:sorbose reductase